MSQIKFFAVRFIVLVILNINTEGIKSRKIKFLTMLRVRQRQHIRVWSALKQNLHNSRAPIIPKSPATFLELHVIFDNMEFKTNRNEKNVVLKDVNEIRAKNA